jgi:hypothetical protein
MYVYVILIWLAAPRAGKCILQVGHDVNAPSGKSFQNLRSRDDPSNRLSTMNIKLLFPDPFEFELSRLLVQPTGLKFLEAHFSYDLNDCGSFPCVDKDRSTV